MAAQAKNTTSIAEWIQISRKSARSYCSIRAMPSRKKIGCSRQSAKMLFEVCQFAIGYTPQRCPKL